MARRRFVDAAGGVIVDDRGNRRPLAIVDREQDALAVLEAVDVLDQAFDRRQVRLPAAEARRVQVAVDIAGGHGRSEEHTSELQSLMRISYAVFCLKKKKNNKTK